MYKRNPNVATQRTKWAIGQGKIKGYVKAKTFRDLSPSLRTIYKNPNMFKLGITKQSMRLQAHTNLHPINQFSEKGSKIDEINYN